MSGGRGAEVVVAAPESVGSHRTGRVGHRALWWIVGTLTLVGVAWAVHAPLLRSVAAILIVEDALAPAAAIVALGGQVPFRPMEAAELYRAGWAPRVVIVRGARLEEHRALRGLGIVLSESWEIEREVLLRRGVPPSAILVPEGEAEGTREELAIIARAVEPGGKPMILVTSKIHTRRVRMTWEHVTEGRSRPIVRIARGDSFDPRAWWRERVAALAVVREYLGLLNYWAGFPVGTRASDGTGPQ